ncbi:MAG: hypothetical protein CFH34_00798 [Alphaproteobacteria bacterium MarineAlpha9_Bin4]|nr:MAG: hypothetical protein CFH34_00798 [Alphaproteobacteria bacterium MarineAlpha9_Bin4]
MIRKYKLKTFSKIGSIRKLDWDRCNQNGNLFTSYNFLKLLEDSNSLSDRTGWNPYYFTWDTENNLQACVAAYEKVNSQGEFVFDHSWANVYQKLGLSYYPKLLIASPFTPITGKRILLRKENNIEFKKKIIDDIIEFSIKKKFSSLHINFIDEEQIKFYSDNNFIIRYGEQFHFVNNGYLSFQDFLDKLSYKKRKAIIKERNSIKKMGIKIEILKGNNIQSDILEELYKFYITTIDKKWSYDYLTIDFFLNLKRYLKDNLVIIIALQGKKVIAAALNFISNNILYGRYWGTKKELPYLHFEVCYYKAIETAIDLNLSKVEAGAQGPHKIKRGYTPALTYSAHLVFNKELHEIFSRYNELEKENILNNIRILKEEYSPYKVISET